MRNLLRADLFCLRRSRVLWLCMAAAFVISAIFLLRLSTDNENMRTLDDAFLQLLPFLSILHAAFIGLFLGIEYQDGTMRNKYDQARAQDMPIIERVHGLAERLGVPMARIALAWHWAKDVTAPIVGCSKTERVDDVIEALGVKLSESDIAYLEEPYTAHELVGPLARPGERALAGTLAPTLKEKAK